MSQDIGDTSLRSSETPPPGSMLGHARAHVESPPGHHRPVRRPPNPARGRRQVRRAPGLGLQAQSPLRSRGGGGARAEITTTQDLPHGTGPAPGRPDRPDPQGADRRRPGRRPGHHRLAPEPSPRPPGLARNDRPHPDPPRPSHPGAQEATAVLLPTLRSHHAQRDLAIRLHPLPAQPSRRPARRRHRDHQLARRLHPIRPARLSAPGHHDLDREGHLPRNSRSARHPRVHPH